ncbi:type II toxin-antitoxin system RelE/ParE family toxin [Sphingomonas sp. LT1P40]|uniref:type II toxin-antitoxin system RelE/ParE family toxin n=1 Tax=Alteristakelama amylovorans TaxID=3096166 RepID=UPI002FCC4FEC
MADIVLSRRARDDFKRIYRFIALDNEAAADRLLLAIDAKIERLRIFPEIGTPREEIAPGCTQPDARRLSRPVRI